MLVRVSVVGIAEEQHYFQREPSQFPEKKIDDELFALLQKFAMTFDNHGKYF